MGKPSSGRLPSSPVCCPAVAKRASAVAKAMADKMADKMAGRPASVFRLLRTGVRRPSSGVCLQSAFTLIELLVVMVIAVVIMAVSLPSFISMGRGAGMRTAVNNIRSTVALSRQWAITHREQITFVASSTGLVWTTNNVPVPATNDHACYYATNASGNLVQSITDLPLDVTFDGDRALTFKTDGGLTIGAATTNVVLVDKRTGITKTISINGLTGGIKVE